MKYFICSGQNVQCKIACNNAYHKNNRNTVSKNETLNYFILLSSMKIQNMTR